VQLSASPPNKITPYFLYGFFYYIKHIYIKEKDIMNTQNKLENISKIINLATTICILNEEVVIEDQEFILIPKDSIDMLKSHIINYNKNVYDTIESEILHRIKNHTFEYSEESQNLIITP
jgi:hypothetical protein